MTTDKVFDTYHPKGYECGPDRHMSIRTLMNILQDIAETGASAIGCGAEYCYEHQLAWFLMNYDIRIDSMPLINTAITAYTWPSDRQMLRAIRDFSIRDDNNHELIAATSQWVLVNRETHKLLDLESHLKSFPLLHERALNSKFTKLPILKEAGHSVRFKVRYDDIDCNGHANNCLYPLWATESIDNDFRMTHTPTHIEICFLKESHYGETIEARSSMTDGVSLHSIIALEDARELARVRIEWK
jgi:medium-chain acyl-[acyl-carrier-protein] hydrolase